MRHSAFLYRVIQTTRTRPFSQYYDGLEIREKMYHISVPEKFNGDSFDRQKLLEVDVTTLNFKIVIGLV